MLEPSKLLEAVGLERKKIDFFFQFLTISSKQKAIFRNFSENIRHFESHSTKQLSQIHRLSIPVTFIGGATISIIRHFESCFDTPYGNTEGDPKDTHYQSSSLCWRYEIY